MAETYNIVDSTGAIIGTVVLNGSQPIPTPVPPPKPAPIPQGAIVIPWQYSTNWYDVNGQEVTVFEFTVGEQTANQQSIAFSNASGSNRFVVALSSMPGSFTSDPTIGSPVIASAFTGKYVFVTNGSQGSSYQPSLKKGSTYFLNVKNANPNADYQVRIDLTP